MSNLEKRIFMICPVNDATDEEKAFLKEYKANLISQGIQVHYPGDDTNQDDLIGLNICSENRFAIKRSDEVHLYYHPKSIGTVFDTGMTFMAEKNLFLINKNKHDITDEFTRLIMRAAYNVEFDESASLYDGMMKRKEEIKQANFIQYEWKGETKEFLLDFGMAFMVERSITLINRKDVERTPRKSFENVLLELDKKYRI